eukprot:CAMPEP_0171223034 /NCGR_PEP_ID=MMETSP0790-20130122/35572_1 /TAXON_ID=2925 /ORGANISM="Alexandrium catenella, Strain OF101" /LENGTH=49 /DNA_ID= /DNA_START= /DNA_END= /DNA_ORIENTATION=
MTSFDEGKFNSELKLLIDGLKSAHAAPGQTLLPAFCFSSDASYPCPGEK